MDELSTIVQHVEDLTKLAAQPCASVEGSYARALQRIRSLRDEVAHLEKVTYLEICRECDELAETAKSRHKELEEAFALARENRANLWNTTQDKEQLPLENAEKKDQQEVLEDATSSASAHPPCHQSSDCLEAKCEAFKDALGLSLEFIGPTEARVRLEEVEGCDEPLVFVLARDKKTQKYSIASCVPRVTLLDKLVANLNCRMPPCTTLGGFLVTLREKYRAILSFELLWVVAASRIKQSMSSLTNGNEVIDLEPTTPLATKPQSPSSRKSFFCSPSASNVSMSKPVMESYEPPTKRRTVPFWMQEDREKDAAAWKRRRGTSVFEEEGELSDQQRYVFDLIVKQKKSIFFTGSAGTGKTRTLREVIKALPQKSTSITALTGIASTLLDRRATTLHSFAGIGLARGTKQDLVRFVKRNGKAVQNWHDCRVLIIDEVSMMSADLFNKLDYVAKEIRSERTKPFGGIQLVLVGDFYQLPPVFKNRQSDANLDQGLKCYESPEWERAIEINVRLTQVYRTKDKALKDMLDEIRDNNLSQRSMNLLKRLQREITTPSGVRPTILYPTNEQVDRKNAEEMSRLSGESETYEAEDSGHPDDLQYMDRYTLFPRKLTLKIGAQVMLLKNQSGDLGTRLVNGSQGKVVGFVSASGGLSPGPEGEALAYQPLDDRDGPEVEFTRESSAPRLPKVQFSHMGEIVEQIIGFENFELETKNRKMKRKQIPLKLSWAMTIHKAQGMSIDCVQVDISRVFAEGQAYVALSRARSIEGLQVLSFDARRFGCSPEVVEFYRTHVKDAPLVYGGCDDTTQAVVLVKSSWNRNLGGNAAVALAEYLFSSKHRLCGISMRSGRAELYGIWADNFQSRVKTYGDGHHDSALFEKHKGAFFGYLAGRKHSSRAAEVNAACGEIHFDMLLPPHPQRRWFTSRPSPQYPDQPEFTDPTDQQLIYSLEHLFGNINRLADRVPLQSIFLVGVYSGAAMAIQTALLYPGILGGVLFFAGWIPLRNGAAHLYERVHDWSLLMRTPISGVQSVRRGPEALKVHGPLHDHSQELARAGSLGVIHYEAPTEEFPWGALTSMMIRPVCGVIWVAPLRWRRRKMKSEEELANPKSRVLVVALLRTAGNRISYGLIGDLYRLRSEDIPPLRIVLGGNQIGAATVDRFVSQNRELIQTVSGILLLNPIEGTPHSHLNRTGPRRLTILHGRKSSPAELSTKLLQGFSDLFSAVPRRCVVTLIVKEVSELLVMGNWAEAVRERAVDRRLLEKCSAGIDLVSLVESIFGSDDEGPPDNQNQLGARARARLSEVIVFLTKNGANSTSFVFITESLSHSLAPSVGDLSIPYAVIDDPLASTPAQQANRTEAGRKKSSRAAEVNAACGEIHFDMLLPPHPQRRWFTSRPSPQYPDQPEFTDPTDQQLIYSLEYLFGEINRLADRVPLQSIFLVGVYSGAAMAIQTALLYPGILGGVLSFAGWIPLFDGAAHLIVANPHQWGITRTPICEIKRVWRGRRLLSTAGFSYDHISMVLAQSGSLGALYCRESTEAPIWGSLASTMSRPVCGVLWVAPSTSRIGDSKKRREERMRKLLNGPGDPEAMEDLRRVCGTRIKLVYSLMSPEDAQRVARGEALTSVNYEFNEGYHALTVDRIPTHRIVVGGESVGGQAVKRFVTGNPAITRASAGILLLNMPKACRRSDLNDPGVPVMSVEHTKESSATELNRKLLQGFSDLFSAVPRRCVVTLIVKEVSELLVMGNWAEAVREEAVDGRILEKCNGEIELVSLVESIFGSYNVGPPDGNDQLGARAGARLSDIIAFLMRNGANSTSFVFITRSLSYLLAPFVRDISIQYTVIDNPLAPTLTRRTGPRL
ncbi:hypothetical protein FOZ61_009115 [Perkinsus olseni]|uniref:ATP-dependent DNA helicase n=1 Tax=Perkinsus olseni TaxID=32597 RepID=A0A7J6M5W5_PEROL|nr:hypothetical protein FOZ61_009115 [Perkinsus olseni]